MSPVSWNVQRLEECKPYWLPWVESVESRALVSRSGGRKSRAPFFVVLRGRLRGIFDMWVRCASSVLGFKGALYRGFFSLADATAWWDAN